MIDTITGTRLQVSTEAETGPYIKLPVSRLDEVRQRLDRKGIPYWVNSLAITLEGEPEITFINFSRYVDAARVQTILDEAQ